MQEFRAYLIDEYKNNATGYVATEFKYNHSTKTKLDKSNIVLFVNTIKIYIKFFDKDMNVLLSKTIVFDNNVLNSLSKKQLINIAPAELENKFNKALPEITEIIMSEYIHNLENIDGKIKNLNRYIGKNCDIIIPSEFKGEDIKIVEDSGVKKNKVIYDM